jgi:hypothetical protein
LVSHTDVVITMLGASATLAGLALVYLGMMISSDQSSGVEAGLPSWATVMFFSPFILGIICVGVSSAWLVTRNKEVLYVATLVAFWMQLALLLVVTLLFAGTGSVTRSRL